MSKMITVEPGFQYSVNIGYDLNNNDKLKSFIPTRSSLELLKEILLSTRQDSNERSRVLIGAYGKGKSHIILTIMSILMQKDRNLFVHLMPKIEENLELKQLVDNYYSDPHNKIFPVIINGATTSLSQAFLLALQRTLDENNLDLMPETNYGAAIQTIEKWKEKYPEVFEKFKKEISVPIDQFISELEDYNVEIYHEFEKIYPSLTAGSTFNPFIGLDVVDLYESVAKSLKKRGYLGIYVVYDEFSKYLESNITEASVSDTKMLQDFAEKCNRSHDAQMHLLLISHKEISNYIDKLPKQKVDGWRGVSERFKHIHLNNNFTQTYEIISSVIKKSPKLWNRFCNIHKTQFEELNDRYKNHAMFSNSADNEINTTIYGCYPLHPVSTYILPRLSERIAQNERTLFTFLSADGPSTLTAFLRKYGDNTFKLLTPDLIFDYFDPVFQKEPISGEMYKNYILTKTILEQIEGQELETKIIKTIALIYMLGQFEIIKPTKDELVGIFSMEYPTDSIEESVQHLIKDEYVIYLKQSNGYLKLKQSSGIDIEHKIEDMIASLAVSFSLKEALNSSNVDNYLYPSRYNDEKEMIRYFKFEFIEEQELIEDIDWNKKSENIQADGIIYGIIVNNGESIKSIKEKILKTSKNTERCIFIIPKKAVNIEKVVKQYEAIKMLRNKVGEDSLLFEEYEVIYEDLQEVITNFIRGYTHPEEYKSLYIYEGEEQVIVRKAELTDLASNICYRVFYDTPVINNEAINKNEITSIARKSRRKIMNGLLRNRLEPKLGLIGTGQEVSILRSTLIRKEIFIDDESGVRINLSPSDNKMKKVLDHIVAFVIQAKQCGYVPFSQLYDELISPEHHIGLRKGVIPIYIAAVFHEYYDEIIILNDLGQIPLTADALQSINASPDEYKLKYLDWDEEKQKFVTNIAGIFNRYVIDAEKSLSAYEFASLAMKRWFLALPKYSKEIKKMGDHPVDIRYRKMAKLLKQNLSGNELLFERLPKAFGYQEFSEGLAENIAEAKRFYDSAISNLKEKLILDTKEIYSISTNRAKLQKSSLTSIIRDWCETLDDHVFEQLFDNGTDKCLGLFKDVTNDEYTFINKLAKIATGLRIEDWDDETEERFISNLKQYKETAENFHTQEPQERSETTAEYEIHFRSDDGSSEIKRFDRVESSKKGKLLYNSIMADIDSMGYSISDQEKRQILMDILKKMC